MMLPIDVARYPAVDAARRDWPGGHRRALMRVGAASDVPAAGSKILPDLARAVCGKCGCSCGSWPGSR